MSDGPGQSWIFVVDDAAAMHRLGEVFGCSAPAGAVLLLDGELGVGKTTFAQGVGRGCGVREHITSPTYNIVLEYQGRRDFTHVDLYRIQSANDLQTLDVDAFLDTPGITCIEWPELVRQRAGPPKASIRFSRSRDDDPGRREVAVVFEGFGWNELSSALEQIDKS